MKKLMLILMVFSLLSMGLISCGPRGEIKVFDEDGSPVHGAQVVFCDGNGYEIQRVQPDSYGSVFYEEKWGKISVRVIPPEGMEAVEAEYETGVKISGEGSTKVSIIVLRNKSGSMTVTETTTSTTTTTSTSTTTQPTTTTLTTSTSGTSTLSTASNTVTTTSSNAKPFVLYPDTINSLYGYNPGTESAALIQDYIDRELLLMYKNSNGALRILLEFAFDQPALREWLNSVESYSAYLVLPRTTETINRQQQAIIYSVDMEAWLTQSSSTPPLSPFINDFSYNFQDLLVSRLDPMGSEIVAVWEKEITDEGTLLPGESGQLDLIPWNSDMLQFWTIEGERGNLSLLIDTPGGTQMMPGTELAWYKSAAIIFVENP
jgi:hypothetical protein